MLVGEGWLVTKNELPEGEWDVWDLTHNLLLQLPDSLSVIRGEAILFADDVEGGLVWVIVRRGEHLAALLWGQSAPGYRGCHREYFIAPKGKYENRNDVVHFLMAEMPTP
jgi:hypothetical protein